MIEQLQHYFHRLTGGIVHTRREVVYILLTVTLAVILIISLIARAALG